MLPTQQQVIKFAVSTCVVVEFKKSTEAVKIANGLIAVPSTNLIPADSRTRAQQSTQFQIPNHPVFKLRLQELLLPTDNPWLEPSTK